MMSGELRIYRKYTSFVKHFLYFGGICPHTRQGNIIYRCLSLWPILSCFILVCTTGNFCRLNVKDIKLLTASLSVFTTMLNVILKACSFSIHEKKLRRADDILDSLLEDTISEARKRSVAFFYLRTFYRLIYSQTAVMTVNTIIFLTKPLILITLNRAKNETSTRYPLPALAAYPWAIDSMLIWQLHYFLEANVCWFVLNISTGVDAFFGFCMFRISASLRILAFEFETQFSKGGEFGETQRKIFCECVRKHALLIECRNIIQTIYGPFILLATVTNAVGICVLIFQAFKVHGNGMATFGMLAVYFSLKLLQTFLYAWPGDVVIAESEHLRCEVYSSAWYECNDTRFAKHFLVVMIQRPIIFKACDIMLVSLDLFAKILNTAISYYFLLETLDSD